MGENDFAALPTALYGTALLMPALAYKLLQITIIGMEGKEPALARAIGRDINGNTSLLLYATAIGLAFDAPAVAHAIYVLVALWWLISDRRIERAIGQR